MTNVAGTTHPRDCKLGDYPSLANNRKADWAIYGSDSVWPEPEGAYRVTLRVCDVDDVDG